MDSHVERGDKHQSTPRYRRSTSIASCCFLLLSPPPAALFRLGPSQAFYFYSLLLLFPSAPPSPAALFRLGTLPDFYLYSSSVTFSIRWGPLEVNNLYIYIYILFLIYIYILIDAREARDDFQKIRQRNQRRFSKNTPERPETIFNKYAREARDDF